MGRRSAPMTPKGKVPMSLNPTTSNHQRTRDRLKALLETGEPYTLQQLADQLAVSRSRIGQLCIALRSRYGIERTRPPTTWKTSECQTCQRQMQIAPDRVQPDNICQPCLKLSRLVRLICPSCNEPFTLTATEHRARRRNKHTYCSKQCLGKAQGASYGWAAYWKRAKS